MTKQRSLAKILPHFILLLAFVAFFGVQTLTAQNQHGHSLHQKQYLSNQIEFGMIGLALKTYPIQFETAHIRAFKKNTDSQRFTNHINVYLLI